MVTTLVSSRAAVCTGLMSTARSYAPARKARSAWKRPSSSEKGGDQPCAQSGCRSAWREPAVSPTTRTAMQCRPCLPPLGTE